MGPLGRCARQRNQRVGPAGARKQYRSRRLEPDDRDGPGAVGAVEVLEHAAHGGLDRDPGAEELLAVLQRALGAVGRPHVSRPSVPETVIRSCCVSPVMSTSAKNVGELASSRSSRVASMSVASAFTVISTTPSPRAIFLTPAFLIRMCVVKSAPPRGGR